MSFSDEVERRAQALRAEADAQAAKDADLAKRQEVAFALARQTMAQILQEARGELLFREIPTMPIRDGIWTPTPRRKGLLERLGMLDASVNFDAWLLSDPETAGDSVTCLSDQPAPRLLVVANGSSPKYTLLRAMNLTKMREVTVDGRGITPGKPEFGGCDWSGVPYKQTFMGPGDTSSPPPILLQDYMAGFVADAVARQQRS